MKNLGYVYETRNKTNGIPYIGKHVGDFNPRYLGSGLHITRAVRKYGVESFEVKILAHAGSKRKLNSLERKYIAEYRKVFPKIYNLSDGGDGWSTGKNNPACLPKSRKKIRASLLRVMSSPEVVKKLSEAAKKKVGKLNHRFGVSLSKSTRNKISRGNRGVKHSKEFCLAISKRFKGKPSHRKGKKMPKITCNRMSKGHQGVPLSEKHKQAIRHPHSLDALINLRLLRGVKRLGKVYRKVSA